MEKNKRIHFPSFDDLLFESRNKDYGAYQLRKMYNSVLNFSTLTASLLFIAAGLWLFLTKPDKEHVSTQGNNGVLFSFQNLAPPYEEKIYAPPDYPPPEAAKIKETVKYVPPEVVDTISPIERKMISNDEAFASQNNEPTDVTVSDHWDGLLPEGDGSGKEEPLFIVQEMPSFRGGDLKKFVEWVRNMTFYPQEAIDNKIYGTVIITFIVEKDGSVSNVTIVKGVHPLLDNEAVKVISGSPKWSPGLQRGQPVRIRYIIPIVFLPQ